MLCFCVSNRNCRPRYACFPAALEAKSLRPARTLGTDYTPVYLTRTISYFTVPYARTNAYYNSFFPHMLHIWNSLPISVVCAPSSLMFKKVNCRTFSSLGSCTGLTYSLLTLSYVHLINLFNYFIVYFILSMFLYSCATHFINPFILGTHLISSLRYCVSCIIAYKLS